MGAQAAAFEVIEAELTPEPILIEPIKPNVPVPDPAMPPEPAILQAGSPASAAPVTEQAPAPAPAPAVKTDPVLRVAAVLCLLASVSASVGSWRSTAMIASTESDEMRQDVRTMKAQLANLERMGERQRDQLAVQSQVPRPPIDDKLAAQVTALAGAVRANQDLVERLPSLVRAEVAKVRVAPSPSRPPAKPAPRAVARRTAADPALLAVAAGQEKLARDMADLAKRMEAKSPPPPAPISYP